MKMHISIVKPLAMLLLVPLLATGASAAYAAQNGDQPSTDMVESARAKLASGGTLAEKVARTQARSEDVLAVARERAAAFARNAAGQSAAQLRAQLPGNAQVLKAEGKPCDDPPANPVAAISTLCKPGEH